MTLISLGVSLRDLLLGKHPKDFDVATNARPDQIQAVFQRQCRLVGRRFRLAHIMFGRDVIEVATFRASHSDARSENQAKQSDEGMLLRDNVYGTIEQDAERRDFTVNALYYNPQDNTLRDYFNGIDDLKNGKITSDWRSRYPLSRRSRAYVTLCALYGEIGYVLGKTK